MDGKTSLEILGSCDRSALISLALHEQLEREGRDDWARLAWVLHLEASRSSDTIGSALGLTD